MVGTSTVMWEERSKIGKRAHFLKSVNLLKELWFAGAGEMEFKDQFLTYLVVRSPSPRIGLVGGPRYSLSPEHSFPSLLVLLSPRNLRCQYRHYLPPSGRPLPRTAWRKPSDPPVRTRSTHPIGIDPSHPVRAITPPDSSQSPGSTITPASFELPAPICQQESTVNHHQSTVNINISINGQRSTYSTVNFLFQGSNTSSVLSYFICSFDILSCYERS